MAKKGIIKHFNTKREFSAWQLSFDKSKNFADSPCKCQSPGYPEFSGSSLWVWFAHMFCREFDTKSSTKTLQKFRKNDKTLSSSACQMSFCNFWKIVLCTLVIEIRQKILQQILSFPGATLQNCKKLKVLHMIITHTEQTLNWRKTLKNGTNAFRIIYQNSDT